MSYSLVSLTDKLSFPKSPPPVHFQGSCFCMVLMLMWTKFPLSTEKLYRPSWMKNAFIGHGSSCIFSVSTRHYRQPKTSSEPKRTGAAFMSCDTPVFLPRFLSLYFQSGNPVLCPIFTFPVGTISDDFTVS